MVQFFEVPRAPGLGELLGSGLAQGLQSVLQNRMEMAAKTRQGDILAKSLGFGTEDGIPGKVQDPERTQEMKQLGIEPEQKSTRMELGALSQEEQKIKSIASNPQAMLKLESMDPNAAKMIQTMNDSILKKEKAGFEKQKFYSEQSKDYRKKISALEEDLPQKRMATERIRDALESKDLKGIQNFLSTMFPDQADFIKTGSAAALESGVKEFFLADLGRIQGGRVNQFIERQLSASYPKAGYDPIANEKIISAMETGVAINEKKVELSDKLEDFYMTKQGYLPEDIDKQLNKALRPFVAEKEKELQDKYKALNKSFGEGKTSKESSKKFSIDGKIYNIPKSKIKEFLEENKGAKGL